MGPKGKICFITPVEETKEIYYCVIIKEIILRGTDDKGVVNVVVDKGKLHIEKSMEKTYDKMYILKRLFWG